MKKVQEEFKQIMIEARHEDILKVSREEVSEAIKLTKGKKATGRQKWTAEWVKEWGRRNDRKPDKVIQKHGKGA